MDCDLVAIVTVEVAEAEFSGACELLSDEQPTSARSINDAGIRIFLMGGEAFSGGRGKGVMEAQLVFLCVVEKSLLDATI